jgi:mono/diheme cytochrome c family protein
MEIRRPSPVLLVSLLVVGGVVAGCGGSDEPSGTVNQPISVGTAEEEFDPSGGTGGTEGEQTAEGGEEAAGDPAAGKEVFASAGCGSCHALADAGASGAVGPNLDDVKPPAATVADVVTNGRGAMPAFAGQLSEDDIANVAAYVSTATGGAAAGGGEDTGGGEETGGTDTAEPNVTEPEGGDTTPLEDTAAAGAEDAGGEDAAAGGSTARGKEIFASAGCGTCHTLADAGASGAVGPNLDEAQPSQDVVAETVTNGRGAMPAFAGQLSEEDIQEVAAYVSAVAGG